MLCLYVHMFLLLFLASSVLLLLLISLMAELTTCIDQWRRFS